MLVLVVLSVRGGLSGGRGEGKEGGRGAKFMVNKANVRLAG